MTSIGGGAIGCEMAQAFIRLGSKCTIVQMDDFLITPGDRQAGELLEALLQKEGIEVYNSKKIARVSEKGNEVVLRTEDGLS